jgi:hypothetical protein
MRALLDINILMSLLDPDHTHHERAHNWWDANHTAGWASCPMTENGVVRIMANPAYSKMIRFSPADLIERLQSFASETNHEFWPEEISLLEEKNFAADRFLRSRQITDIYLLATAAKRHGRLVTFDQTISLSAVHIAKPENLCVL